MGASHEVSSQPGHGQSLCRVAESRCTLAGTDDRYRVCRRRVCERSAEIGKPLGYDALIAKFLARTISLLTGGRALIQLDRVSGGIFHKVCPVDDAGRGGTRGGCRL